MNPITVIQLSNQLGLGGTERNLQNITYTLDRKEYAIHSVGYYRLGARAKLLADHGYPVHDCQGSLDIWKDLLATLKPKIVIFHRSGLGSETETAILGLAHQARATIYEVNVFGQPDHFNGDQFIDGHIHVSWFSFLKYLRLARLNRSPHRARVLEKHRVIYNGVDIEQFDNLVQQSNREALRNAAHINPTNIMLTRIARPDLNKWDDAWITAAQGIIRRIPAVRFVLRAAPPTRVPFIKRMLKNNVVLLPPTESDREIIDTYVMSDILFHTSKIGESFGYTLAEAMLSRLPVLVNATYFPRDSAQMELITHRHNGMVAKSVAGLIQGSVELAQNSELRKQYGDRGRTRTEDVFAIQHTIRDLEAFLRAHVTYSLNEETLQHYERQYYEACHCTLEHEPLFHWTSGLLADFLHYWAWRGVYTIYDRFPAHPKN